MGDTVEWWSAW